jgi:hypothetical protein
LLSKTASRWTRHLSHLTVLMLLPWVISACSGERDASELLGPTVVEVPVVNAVLYVGQPLPRVLLTRTLGTGVVFSPENTAITGARVSISTDAWTREYIERNPGVYELPGTGTVRPNTTYRLRAELVEGGVVTAETTTPDSLTMEAWVLLENDAQTVREELVTFDEVGDQVFDLNRLIHSDGLLEAWAPVRPVMVPFQVGIESLDLGSDFVIDVSFLDPEDLEDFERHAASPPIIADDGRLRLPWLAIAFEGRYVLRIFAVDNNWFDLIRSLPELADGGNSGFGGNAGDNFELPLFHIEGGIGLFGSAAVDSIGFTIFPPDTTGTGG